MLNIQKKPSTNTTGTLQGVGKVWVNTGAKQKRGKCEGPVVARECSTAPIGPQAWWCSQQGVLEQSIRERIWAISGPIFRGQVVVRTFVFALENRVLMSLGSPTLAAGLNMNVGKARQTLGDL